ncbi:protein scarlet-like isoform X2 [Ischnura elegans]|nr:protein scarlet-like isoform X2 [Ischnura elegans]
MEMEDPFMSGIGLPPDRLPLIVHEGEEMTESHIDSDSPVERLTNGGQPSFTLAWRNISVKVKRKRKESFLSLFPKYEKAIILNNVSGVVHSGSLVAIMGASGAGKTTLLATISQRIKAHTTGDILLNGQSVSKEVMRNISGFVPQQDLTVETLTVEETLNFMSRLKMNPAITETDRRKWIRSILAELGLNKCINTRISGLSGGERKRMTLAVQLLTDPPILFCDEPTTGLDSYSAGAVIEKLRQLTTMGKAVICTIHQPASGLFDLFHRVMLLAGGRLAYLGDVADAPNYFRSLGLDCPPTYNAAEFYVQQLAVTPGREEQCLKRIETLCDRFALSSLGMSLQAELCSISCSSSDDGYVSSLMSDTTDIKSMNHPKIPYYTQLYWLTWRTFVDERRQWSVHAVRLGLFMFVSMVLAFPFMDIKTDQHGVQSRQGLLYLVVTETIFTYAYAVQNTFPQQMPILLREISDGLYHPWPYYVSKMITLLPKSILEPIPYAFLIFYVVGLSGGFYGFFFFCIPVILCATSSTAYGAMLSASFESVSTSSLVSVPVDLICIAFSGIYIQLSTVPTYLSWIRYVSQFYYANEAISILQWRLVPEIECSDNPDVPCFRSGDEVLDNYGFSQENLPIDLFGLMLIYVVSHVVGYICFHLRSRTQPTY